MTAINRSDESRAAASRRMLEKRADGTFMARSNASRCWCPPEYAALSRKMRKHGYSAAERRAAINNEIERARVAGGAA